VSTDILFCQFLHDILWGISPDDMTYDFQLFKSVSIQSFTVASLATSPSVCLPTQTGDLLSLAVRSSQMLLAPWRKSSLPLPHQRYGPDLMWSQDIQTNWLWGWETWHSTLTSRGRPGAAAARRPVLPGRSVHSVAKYATPPLQSTSSTNNTSEGLRHRPTLIGLSLRRNSFNKKKS